MLTIKTRSGDKILKKVLERCSSLRKLQQIVVLIHRWRKVKSTMGEPLKDDGILATKKFFLR